MAQKAAIGGVLVSTHDQKPQINWADIEKIFADVVELDANAVEEYWRTEHVSVDHQKIVESLLVHDRAMLRIESSRSGSSNHLVAAAGTDDAAPHRPARQLLFSPGTTFDDIELLFPSAQTGNSEVWCAQLIESRRRVAVKFLLESDDATSATERFAREIETLKRLKHPNIAAIHDAGAAPSGHPYFVMQWIDGVPITDFCDQHRLTIKQRVALICTLCDAIDYAHKFLIVHRDLKPENVLVTDEGELFVLDFGIAKTIAVAGHVCHEDTDQGLNHQSIHAEIRLTPAYAAPEQYSQSPVTTATDVHGIGILLYELLCGHHPFSPIAQPGIEALTDRVCSGVPERINKIAAMEAVPIDAVPMDAIGNNCSSNAAGRKNPQLIAGYRKSTPRQLRRALRGKLELICVAALRKEPEDRIASPAELKNELTHWQQNRPLNLETSGQKFTQRLSRHPLRLAMVCAALGAAIAALIGYRWIHSLDWANKRQIQKLSRTNKAATDDLKLARSNANRLRQENDQMTAVLTRIASDPLQRGSPEDGDSRYDVNSVAETASINVIRTLAGQGDFAAATKLIDQVKSPQRFPLQDRILMSDAMRQIGRTTASMQLVADVLQSPEPQFSNLETLEQKFTAVSMARLMLQAGWPREASDWIQRLSDARGADSEDSSDACLLELEILVALQEFESATEKLIDCARLRDNSYFDPEQQLKFRELEIEVAIGNGQLKDAAKLLQALPAIPKRYPIQGVKRLKLRAALESESAEKLVTLQRGLDLLAASELPNHPIALELYVKLDEINSQVQSDEATSPWLEKAWRRIESTGEFGTQLAFAVVQSRAQSEGPTDVLADRELLQPYRYLLSQDPYYEKSYAFALLKCILKQDDTVEKGNSTTIVLSEAENLLAAAETIGSETRFDTIYAYCGMLHCESNLKPAQVDEVKSSLREALQAELASQQHASKIFLIGVLESMDRDDLGSCFQWINRYQNSQYAEAKDQQQMVVYVAQQSLSEAEHQQAEFLINQFLLTLPNPEDRIDLQLDAAFVISKLPQPSERSVNQLLEIRQRINRGDDKKWLDQLPALELNTAFYSNRSNTASLAAQLLKAYPDSQPLQEAVWTISQALKLSGDNRYQAWKSLE